MEDACASREENEPKVETVVWWRVVDLGYGGGTDTRRERQWGKVEGIKKGNWEKFPQSTKIEEIGKS